MLTKKNPNKREQIQFVRSSATTSVGQKSLGTPCLAAKITGRGCRGKLHDTILDWEHNLPENDLIMADYHSSVADLSICLGTTLQIVPSGKLPLLAKKNAGLLAIVNLQPTKLDKRSDLLINYYVDDVMIAVMKRLGLEIPEYSRSIDPTKSITENNVKDWNFRKDDISDMKEMYSVHYRNNKRIKQENKIKRKSSESKNDLKLKEQKIEYSLGDLKKEESAETV